MKKFALIIVSALLLSTLLYGCTTNEDQQDAAQVEDQGNLINIVTTIFAPFDFAREIAGTRATVSMLIPPGQDAHAFQPTPMDIISIQNADFFIHVGGHKDALIYRILDEIDSPNMRRLALIDTVDLVIQELVEGMEHHHDHDHGHHHGHGHDHHDDDCDDDDHHHHGHGHDHHDDDCDDDDCDYEGHDHSHGHGHGHHHDDDCSDDDHHHHDHGHSHDHHHADDCDDADCDYEGHDHSHGHHHHHHDDDCDDACPLDFDEHVWTTPRNAMQIVREITAILSEIDPDNAYYFEANLAAYLIQLEELDVAFRDVVDTGVRRTIIFGDRFPFRYFVDEYGLSYYAAFSGCSTDTDPSAATVAFLITKANELQLPVVFHIELSNRRLAYTIADGTGARVLELHSAHNITRNDYLAGLSYIDIMWANVSALREALH